MILLSANFRILKQNMQVNYTPFSDKCQRYPGKTDEEGVGYGEGKTEAAAARSADGGNKEHKMQTVCGKPKEIQKKRTLNLYRLIKKC